MLRSRGIFRRDSLQRRRLRLEPLEDRRLLAVFTVTNLSDGPVAAPGDLPGSLRQAIYDANNSPAADQIAWQAGLSGAITLTDGELLIADDVDVTGLGNDQTTIDAADSSRVIRIDDGSSALIDVSLASLRIANGFVLDDGGGIWSSENLTISDAAITGNRTGDGGAGSDSWHGGGIYSSGGSLAITGSTISGNSTGHAGDNNYGGGGDGGNGGGIYSSGGSLTITGSTISGNSTGRGGYGYGFCGGDGGHGGGIHFSGGSLTITGSTISYNATGSAGDSYFDCGGDGGNGGGVYSRGGSSTIIDSTISVNSTGNGGDNESGGEYGGHGGNGGGIYSSSGSLTMTGSTISGNATGIGGFGRGDYYIDGSGGDGGGISAAGDLRITDSTISANSTADGGDGGGIYARDGSSTITDSEISGNSTGDGRFRFDEGGDGGGIFTSGSLTITGTTISGNSTGKGADDFYAGSGGDGGGISASSFFDFSVIITNSSVHGNSTGDGGDGTPSGLGGGAGGGSGGGISIGGSVTGSSSLVITDTSIFGNSTGSGGDSGSYYYFGDGGAGGGISAGVSSMITNSSISGNSTGAGGGGDYPGSGGVGGGIFASDTFTMSYSTVSDNHTGNGRYGGVGGGIRARDDLNIYHSTISNNTTGNSEYGGYFRAGDGGGIYFGNSGRAKIFHSTITGNNTGSEGSGGGIHALSYPLWIENSLVAGNADSGSAPDMLRTGPGTLTVRHSLFGSNLGSGLTEAPVGMPDMDGNLIGGPTYGVINPLLGPLADNGGSTPTHLLLEGSPAIDAGDPNAAPPPFFDQRGAPFSRFQDGDGDTIRRIDMGAVEWQPLVSFTGDFNHDGLYDCLDIDELIAQIAAGTNAAEFDLTGDSIVDLADRDWWLGEAGEANLGRGLAYLLGDATLDGFVDGQDFIVWNANKFSPLPVVFGWCEGNFNADAVVDGADFIIWNQHKFQSSFGTSLLVSSPPTGEPEESREPRQVQVNDDNVFVAPSRPPRLSALATRRLDAVFAALRQVDESPDEWTSHDIFEDFTGADPIKSWVL